MGTGLYLPKKIHELDLGVVKYIYDGEEKVCIPVEISGEEYELCDKASKPKNFWGSSKTGHYGSGVASHMGDKFRTARIGMLGQMAFGKVFGEPVDFVYREGGDKYDNLLAGKIKIDVKCAIKNRGTGLVLQTSERGRKINLDKHIYVFGFLRAENRVEKRATVILVGYAKKSDVENCEVKPGVGDWLNYVVPFKNLRPIFDLLDAKEKITNEFQSRKTDL